MSMFGRFFWASAIPTPVLMGVATLFGVGKLRWAPGTLGSVFGVLWYVTFFWAASFEIYLLFLLVSFYLAAGISDEAAKRLGKEDPSEVVIDEFVVMPICYLGTGPWLLDGFGWFVLPFGFIMFRFFDIAKPLGIRMLERVEGGWGIVLDDAAAAVMSCICLHVALVVELPQKIVG